MRAVPSWPVAAETYSFLLASVTLLATPVPLVDAVGGHRHLPGAGVDAGPGIASPSTTSTRTMAVPSCASTARPSVPRAEAAATRSSCRSPGHRSRRGPGGGEGADRGHDRDPSQAHGSSPCRVWRSDAAPGPLLPGLPRPGRRKRSRRTVPPTVPRRPAARPPVQRCGSGRAGSRPPPRRLGGGRAVVPEARPHRGRGRTAPAPHDGVAAPAAPATAPARETARRPRGRRGSRVGPRSRAPSHRRRSRAGFRRRRRPGPWRGRRRSSRPAWRRAPTREAACASPRSCPVAWRPAAAVGLGRSRHAAAEIGGPLPARSRSTPSRGVAQPGAEDERRGLGAGENDGRGVRGRTADTAP